MTPKEKYCHETGNDQTRTTSMAFSDGWDSAVKALKLSIGEVTPLQECLSQIGDEVERAKKKFPGNFHNQHEGYAVILEEVDELWDEVKKNQKNYDLAAQRKEAIQAAAMLVRFITELTPIK